jgi:glyoxylase-like metal-dependent hydrolase (beta-lactamase superfamily II)
MDTAELPQLDLGAIRLRWLHGGAFRMDGAAVFGQLPRPVWSTLLAPDDDNRVGLVARVLLVETGGELGLIEAGLPHTLTSRQRAALAVERASSLEEDLMALGIGCRDIRWVILTHLHPDHAGGVVVQQDDVRAVLFADARHVVQRLEVELFQNPEYPRRDPNAAQDFEVLLAAGLVELVDGEATVAPGVRVVRTGGHTPGHQAVILEGQQETAICLGDLLPTRHHLDPVCVPAVDDFPLDSIAAKRAQLGRADQLGAWLTLAHDPDMVALRRTPDGSVAGELRSSIEPSPQPSPRRRGRPRRS